MKKTLLFALAFCLNGAAFAASAIQSRPDDPKAIYLEAPVANADSSAASRPLRGVPSLKLRSVDASCSTSILLFKSTKAQCQRGQNQQVKRSRCNQSAENNDGQGPFDFLSGRITPKR
jgi:hypothetical protein